MRYLTHKGRGAFLTFLAPDDGGRSGNNSGSSSNVGTVDVETLFKDIPFDELDNKTQQAITKARDTLKAEFATLQKKSIDDPEQKQKVDQLQRDLQKFQSERDQALDKLTKLTGSSGKEPTEDEYLTVAQTTLRKSGFSEEDVKKQAPIYAEMLKGQLQVFRKELGKDFGPVVGTVLAQEARSAFEEAQERDSSGMLGVPEVAEKVWQQILGRVKVGQPSNSDLVLNLAKIAWMDHTTELRNKGEEIPALRTSPKSDKTEMNTGFSFPGATRTATQPTARVTDNSNKPRHEMNADTEAAVTTTFKELYRTTGVAPENLKPKFEKGRK